MAGRDFSKVAGRASFVFSHTQKVEGEVVSVMRDSKLSAEDAKHAKLRGGLHYWNKDTLSKNLDKVKGNPTAANRANEQEFQKALEGIKAKEELIASVAKIGNELAKDKVKFGR